MNRYARISGLALVLVAALGCEQRTDKTDDGGIILSISDFDGLPISISASERATILANRFMMGSFPRSVRA